MKKSLVHPENLYTLLLARAFNEAETFDPVELGDLAHLDSGAIEGFGTGTPLLLKQNEDMRKT